MRVLWFTNTPSLYNKAKGGYNGGGWISSLERAMMSNNAIKELAISFFDFAMNSEDVKLDKISYYPVNLRYPLLKRLKYRFFWTKYDQAVVHKLLEVVHKFKPDVIHIFGSENCFGLLKEYTDIPVVLHLQGIMNPYLNAYFIPHISTIDYLRYIGLKSIYSKIHEYLFFKRGAERERKIFSLCQNYMGRTSWDKSVIKLLGRKDLNYFYCSEVLRSRFYTAKSWDKERSGKLKIATTISRIEYKGFDLILKTARLLKEYADFDFEWIVFGIEKYSFLEKKLKIKSKDVNVNLAGVVDEDDLVNFLLNSDMFVHTSYIDNSPNSLCEAQILGLPIISTNVGGISSLIEDNKTGILVPSNDPFYLALKIIEMANNATMAKSLGEQARVVAQVRHDVDQIVSRNIEIYQQIQ